MKFLHAAIDWLADPHSVTLPGWLWLVAPPLLVWVGMMWTGWKVSRALRKPVERTSVF
jgi:hypothetical protein